MSEVLKVKPWSEDQGEYVLIDADKFDPEFHKLLDEVPAERKRGRPSAQVVELKEDN